MPAPRKRTETKPQPDETPKVLDQTEDAAVKPEETKEDTTFGGRWPEVIENKSKEVPPKGKIIAFGEEPRIDGVIKDNQFIPSEDHYQEVRFWGSRRPSYQLLAPKGIPLPVTMAPEGTEEV